MQIRMRNMICADGKYELCPASYMAVIWSLSRIRAGHAMIKSKGKFRRYSIKDS